ncbi:ricin-type beta-trefoil lectin domain protein [Streptomyces sp. NPDC048566]|uniref:ricin-type beta-trefoil lectin domain protein n=1 Tax=Streptomyces sp. NPDC048566 TaxID=3365569 RepID=UPI00371EFAB7
MRAVVVYARVFTTQETAGEHLAAESFTRAVEELRAGVDPLGTARHHALTHVRETAGLWAADSRREHLRTDFLAWTLTAGARPANDPSAVDDSGHGLPNVMLSAFAQLAEYARGVLWYSVVDAEPSGTVAAFASVPARAVPDLLGKAHRALHAAYVQEHLARHGTPRCEAFRRLVEAASSAGEGRHHPDLVAHLADCSRCTQLLGDLRRMSDDPRGTLAEGLLPWGGAAYATGIALREIDGPDAEASGGRTMRSEAHAPHGNATGAVRAPAGSGAVTGPAHRSARRRRLPAAVLALSALALVSVVAASAVLDRQDGPPDARPAPRQRSTPSASGTRSASAQPSLLRVGVPAQLVHAGTGLCLDVEGEKVQKHVNAVAATCTSTPTQRWTLDSEGRLHNTADPDFCLKADGNAAAIGIRPCASDDPEKRSRMTFFVRANGAITSRPRPEQAVVPVGTFTGTPLLLALKELGGTPAQTWTARAAPAS